MDYPCGKFGHLYQPFWFYRADRQTDRITDADDRYTHTTPVGVSNCATARRNII